jgi:hypothetical protein
VDAVKMSFHTFHGDLNESSKTAKTQYSRKIGKIMDRIKQRVGKSPEWKPMENPFTKPFASDKKEVKESHNIKTLEGFPLSKLVKLHREYSSKGTKEAKREAANILRIMRSKQMSEAVSAGDPNRGRSGRAKPKLQPNEDPYDRYTKGEIKPYGGKLQKRLRSLSPEARQRYYREVGMRSRAASRAGKTGRLFPQV